MKARITSICCKQRFLTPQTLLFWRAHYLIVPSSVLHLPECTVICRSSITNHSPFNGCSVDGWYGDVCLDRTPLEYGPPSLAHPKNRSIDDCSVNRTPLEFPLCSSPHYQLLWPPASTHNTTLSWVSCTQHHGYAPIMDRAATPKER